MADRPSESEVEARLREFFGAEVERAEVDFPFIRRRQRPPSRRPSPAGLLAATVAIVVLGAVGSRLIDGRSTGTTGTAVESPGVSVTPDASSSEIVPPSASPSLDVPASLTTEPPSTSTTGPSASPGEAMDGIAECGRIPIAACRSAIALVRVKHKAEVSGATRIVVDDTCPPGSACDRPYPFDTAVVFVTAGGDTTGWYWFHVYGPGQLPTKAEPWLGEWPDHIVQRLREPQPTP
jgi:hypothetical protein